MNIQSEKAKRKVWEPSKGLSQNISDILCKSSEMGAHQHTQACFKYLRSKEELEAVGRLTSQYAMSLDDANYLASVVEPLVETLSSHNGGEPSFLYSLLQKAVREFTDRLETHVQAIQVKIARKTKLLDILSGHIQQSAVPQAQDVDQTLEVLKAESALLRKKYEDLSNKIQAQSKQNFLTSNSTSNNDRARKDYSSRLAKALDGKKSEYQSAMIEVHAAATALLEAKERNQEIQAAQTEMSKVMSNVPKNTVNNVGRLFGNIRLSKRFTDSASPAWICAEDPSKNFPWNGERGLCDNLTMLLFKYIGGRGHSSDRVESAKKIYNEVLALKGAKLTSLERDHIILGLIRKEKIASKGRWTGSSSELFAIYRTAEFAHQQNLKREAKKVMSPKLERLKDSVNKREELSKLLITLQEQKTVVDQAKLTLSQLRENELGLIMDSKNVPQVIQSDEDELRLIADSMYQTQCAAKLEELSKTEEAIELCHDDIDKKEIETARLTAESELMIRSIKAQYDKLRQISLQLDPERNGALPVLPISDKLKAVEMVENAKAFIVALRVSTTEPDDVAESHQRTA